MNKRRESGRRTHARHQEHTEDWMTSYSDIISLLFAFLAIILSVSKIDASKMDRLSSSISGTFSGQQQASNMDTIKDTLEASLVNAGYATDATVRRSSRGIEIDLSSAILFNEASADLSKEAVSVLATVSDTINAMPVVLEVEGHTDSVPIRSSRFPSNWELSGARASEVVRHFIELGFEPKRLKAVALADTRPPQVDEGVADEDEAARLARQRRVTLVLVPALENKMMASRPTAEAAFGSH